MQGLSNILAAPVLSFFGFVKTAAICLTSPQRSALSAMHFQQKGLFARHERPIIPYHSPEAMILVVGGINSLLPS